MHLTRMNWFYTVFSQTRPISVTILIALLLAVLVRLVLVVGVGVRLLQLVNPPRVNVDRLRQD